MALEFFTGVVVSSLLQDFIDKIKTSTYDQICHAFSDVQKKLKTLEGSYMKAQLLLDKVDGWELVTSKAHRDWVGDAMRACYDMEDLTVDIRIELRKTGNALSSYLKNWVVSREIDALQSNLDQVLAKEADFVTFDRRSTGPTTNTAATAREPEIIPAKRRGDKEEIVKTLLHSTSIIISIAGMFGLGKTILAQAVKNDPRIHGHYDHKFWVPVSGDFNLVKVISSMMMQDQKLENAEEEQFTRTFQRLYRGGRVLIVLDDMHSFTRHQDFEEFISALLSYTSMFAVLITTRNPNITKRVSSLKKIPVVSYWLQLMPDKDCQLLIISRAKATGDNNPFKRKRCMREENALTMAEKFCKGLPLVADIFSVRLSSEPEDNWFKMLSRDLWDMPGFMDQIFPAFRLDYSNLPRPVKNCFRYLSLFPSNFEFKKQALVRLWMAEGFIMPKIVGHTYHQSLEETGNEYFDELLSRSMLQIYHPCDEESQVYSMHEFIHRYAQYVSSDIYLRIDKEFVSACFSVNANRTTPQLNDGSDTWYSTARHISFLCHSVAPSILRKMEKCKALRTLVCPQQGTCVGPLSYNLFLKLQSLRVLNLSGTDISNLPESLGKLKHLQLLDVSSTDIQDLPASTTYLQELWVLKLSDCGELLRLPKDTRNLTNLLHLEIDGTGLSSMPRKIGKLIKLRTLPVFFVGDDDGYSITELKNMKHLEGSICLKNMENVTAYAEAREAKLSNKSLLRELELEWSSCSIDQLVAEQVLDGLEPHENLEELRISGYDGAQLPSWLSSPQCGLKIIHLQGCHKCSILPPLGQLQHLRELHIQGLHGVKYVDRQFSTGGGVAFAGFPELVSLKFQDMKNLEKWDALQAIQMPRLRELMIMDCPKLIALPSLIRLTSLQKLEICGCPILQSSPMPSLPSSLESLMVEGTDKIQKIDD